MANEYPKYTVSLQPKGEISVTLRTDNEDEIEDFLERWGQIVHANVDRPNGNGNGHKVPKVGDTCIQCHSGRIIRRNGRNGAFLACDHYPDCRYTESIAGKR